MTNESEVQQNSTETDNEAQVQNETDTETAKPAEENTAEEAVKPEEKEELTPEKLLKDLEEAQKKVREYEEENKNLREEILRARAEVQNMRKRCEQDVQKAKDYSITRFAQDLVPPLEAMEKAVEYSGKITPDNPEMVAQVVEGVKGTMAVLLKAMENNGLKAIKPANGDEFNPELHEAMTFVPNPAIPANHIIDTFRTGYSLNGRIIRAAQVVVSAGNGGSVNTEA